MPPLPRMTHLVLFLILLMWTTSPSSTTAQVDGFAGGWSQTEVTQNTSSLLERALQNETSYAKGVTARVCVYEIRSLSQQVVSGMNYRYDVQACPVSTIKSAGMCAAKILTTNSSCGEYKVQLYEQWWTNTLQVTAIELVSTDVGADADVDKTSSTHSSNGTNNTASSNNSSTVSSDTSGKNSTVVTPAPSATTAKNAVAGRIPSYSAMALVTVCATTLAAIDW